MASKNITYTIYIFARHEYFDFVNIVKSTGTIYVMRPPEKEYYYYHY